MMPRAQKNCLAVSSLFAYQQVVGYVSFGVWQKGEVECFRPRNRLAAKRLSNNPTRARIAPCRLDIQQNRNETATRRFGGLAS